jgi:hypothetical protein
MICPGAPGDGGFGLRQSRNSADCRGRRSTWNENTSGGLRVDVGIENALVALQRTCLDLPAGPDDRGLAVADPCIRREQLLAAREYPQRGARDDRSSS